MDEIREIHELRARIVTGWLSGVAGVADAPTSGERVEGQLVPDLSALEPEDWVPAIRPLGRRARYAAADTVPAGDRRNSILRYVLSEPLFRREPAIVQAAIDEPVHRPVPKAAVRRRAHRQVNFRLDDQQHERLTAAAGHLGLTPAALAKAFCLSGVTRALEEA